MHKLTRAPPGSAMDIIEPHTAGLSLITRSGSYQSAAKQNQRAEFLKSVIPYQY